MQSNKILILNHEDIISLLSHYNFVRFKESLNAMPTMLFNILAEIAKEEEFVAISYSTDKYFLFSFRNGEYKLPHTNNLVSFYKWFLTYYQNGTHKFLEIKEKGDL